MKDVQKPIICIKLDNELDIVLAYKRAMQIAEMSGLSFTEQTKFATAVSEISRNVLEHAIKGKVDFHVNIETASPPCLKAFISDYGPGIKNIKQLLSSPAPKRSGKGVGITHSRRLVDSLEIESEQGKGTTVLLAKRLPANHPPINHLILSGWRKYFAMVPAISPYDELKRQNNTLLDTLEELKQKNALVETQLEEISTLNNDLENNLQQIRRMSEEAAHQNKLLTKRNEELDEFAYILSHDLKAPFRNLEGLLSLIESEKAERREKAMPMVREQLNRIDRLINSISAYSRAGREKIEKSKVVLYDLIKDVIGSLQVPDHIQVFLETNFPVLHTEEVYLSQIFTNLISNAVKYNNRDNGCIRIGYLPDQEGKLMFFIEDNGPGVPQEEREKVFKMFVVLTDRKQADSSGIGLAIVKKIIDEKGGKIWIEDNKTDTQGCRFIFTWPAELVE